ncbi:MAG: hypothetical protein E6Q58_05045 [Niabella sp.]|nr:MAG: hypothetical protein E6Q58_05045 [Niabella sp.]
MSETFDIPIETQDHNFTETPMDRREFMEYAGGAVIGGVLANTPFINAAHGAENSIQTSQNNQPRLFSRRDLFRLRQTGDFQLSNPQESQIQTDPIIHLESPDKYLNQQNIYPYENGGKIPDSQIAEVVNFYKSFNDFGNLTPNQIYTLVTQAALNHNESSILMFEPPYDLSTQILTADVITDHMFPTGEASPTTVYENLRAITPHNGIPFSGLKNYNPYTINRYLFAKGKQLSAMPYVWNVYKDIAGNAILRQSKYLLGQSPSPKYLGCFNARKILDPVSDGWSAQQQQINWIQQTQNVKAYRFNKGGNLPWFIAGLEIPEYISDPYNKGVWQAFEKHSADKTEVINALKTY